MNSFYKAIVLAMISAIGYLDSKAQAVYSIATNHCNQNWEVSLGCQGLSFYSNQEAPLGLSKNPFKSFRTNLNISASLSKSFSPEIKLRTKASGYWGRSVSSNDKNFNAVKYVAIQEDVMLNLSNVAYQYKADRFWNVIPYMGIGMARNFTHNENALTFNIGVVNTYRINKKFKTFFEISYNIMCDNFDNQNFVSNNVFKSHDRMLAAEIGLTLELGQNRWKHVTEIGNIEIDTYGERENNLKLSKRQNTENTKSELEFYNETKQAVAVFFEIGSSELKHQGQLENLKELVKTAKAENRTIIVTGYADGTTEYKKYNEKLSARRADIIRKEIVKMGIEEQKIKMITGGGVTQLDKNNTNRRVTVSIEN